MKLSLYVIEKQIDLDSHGLQEALDRINNGINRCDRIIDEMLDFTRVKGLDRQSIQVDKWLATLLDEQDVPEGITIKRDLGIPGCSLLFDPDRMRRAVINIFENACQAVHMNDANCKPVEQAEITVTTQQQDNRVEIIIADNGTGIPDKELQKIFEPLFSTKTFGVGLGLSVVKQIMEQHEGEVTIETGKESGTRVILYLPLQTQDENTAAL